MTNYIQSSDRSASPLLIALLLLTGCASHQIATTQPANLQPISMPQTLYADEARRSFIDFDDDNPHLRHPEPATVVTVEAAVIGAKWPFFDAISVSAERKVQFEITKVSPRLSYRVGDRILLRNCEDGHTAGFFVPNLRMGGHYELVFETDGRFYGVRNMHGEYFEREPPPTATSTQPLFPDQRYDPVVDDQVNGWMKICTKLTDIKYLLLDVITGKDPDYDPNLLEVKMH